MKWAHGSLSCFIGCFLPTSTGGIDSLKIDVPIHIQIYVYFLYCHIILLLLGLDGFLKGHRWITRVELNRHFATKALLEFASARLIRSLRKEILILYILIYSGELSRTSQTRFTHFLPFVTSVASFCVIFIQILVAVQGWWALVVHRRSQESLLRCGHDEFALTHTQRRRNVIWCSLPILVSLFRNGSPCGLTQSLFSHQLLFEL